MILSDLSIEDLLGFDGPLAQHLPGFAPREEQLHLASAVHDAMQKSSVLVGEAGTGIGKTFAYLVPAIESGKRVIVSTGTRHLQDQLFHTDLPVIKRALGTSLKASLLKGRANYLCRHRLIRAARNPALRDAKNQEYLAVLMDWSRSTELGDIAEVLAIPEDAMIWSYITSNAEFCSEHEFEDQKDCFVFEARKRAQASDIVVVNHHLLCADLALKDEGYGELLPSANAFVIDEAHQLPEVAANFFGRKLTSRQLNDLAQDIIGEQLREASDMPELREAAMRLEESVRHFRLAFGVDPTRDAWVAVAEQAGIEREHERLDRTLDVLGDILESVSGRAKGLESCRKRVVEQRRILQAFSKVDAPEETGENGYIHWFETYRSGFSLNMTPINVAEPFRKAMDAMPASWIFTSATLAVGGDFSHFKSRLGLTSAEELQVDSPFDYTNHALMYLPQNLPEPSSPRYTELAMEAVLPVIKASAGRCFVLFTSYRALHVAEKFLATRIPYPILTQGKQPKRELLEAFQSVGNAVLLGTSSFWEGVDVRGEALSCVIIDKLPFGSPGDPVMSARISNMQRSGGNPFFEYQLPQAAISLKQGVGRLIRDVTDRGVLVLCDPRIESKPYGRIFIDSLPPMPITRDIEEVEDFYRREREELRDEEPVTD